MKTNSLQSLLNTVGLGHRSLHQLVLFAVMVLIACIGGLVAVGHVQVLSQASAPCWHCPAVLISLTLLVGLALLQTVVAAVFPAMLLPKLLKGAKVTLLFWISVFASMINAFLPAKAGTGAKAILFKKVLGVDYTTFAVVHILASGLSLFVSLIVLLVFYWRYGAQTFSSTVEQIGAVPGWLVAMAVIFVIVVVVACLRRKSASVVEAVLKLQDRVVPLALMLVIAVLQVALIGGRAMIAANLFGVIPAWEKVLFFGAILSLVPLISLVPGGVGVREAVFVVAGSVAGIPIEVSLSAALVDRIAGTVLVSLLGGVGLRRVVEAFAQERSLPAT